MKAYRLLDAGEPVERGDEVFTVSGWTCLDWLKVGEDITNPVRRLDDGKGKYVLVDIPVHSELAEDLEFWRWGVGWLFGGSVRRKDETVETLIWRKPRAVVAKPKSEDVAASKSSEAAPGGHWVVVNKLQKTFPLWFDACKAAKQQAIDEGAGAEYSVCRIDTTFLCEMRVVEKEKAALMKEVTL